LLAPWLQKAVFGSIQGSAASFNPISLGVVGAWWDVAEASDAGAGLAFTVPNQLTANHLTTSVDAHKPVLGVAANGVPIMTANVSNLACSLHAAINSPTTWGVAFHAKLTTLAAVTELLTVIPPNASASKLLLTLNPGAAGVGYNRCIVFQDALNSRRFQTDAGVLLPLNTWVHITIELNLATGGAESTRGVMCVDGVPVAVLFSDGTGAPGSLPVAMPTPTGSLSFLSRRSSDASNPFKGEIGRHIFIFSGAMPGATSGLLTSAARLSLSNFDRPT
jgi:hypothetical protein